MDSAVDLDIDNDQLPDFRLLLTSSQGSSAAPSLPKKTAKSDVPDSQALPLQSLDDQYNVFYQILQEERSISEKNLSRAIYDPSVGLFRVTVNKGGHFNTMGQTRDGQVYAFPEEALFLVDRGSLMVQHHGVDVTVQQMWTLYFEGDRILSSSPSSSVHRPTTSSPMDRYQVYAYLKRLGFIVTRPGIYKPTNARKSSSIDTTMPTFSTVLMLRSRVWHWWALASHFIMDGMSTMFRRLFGSASAWIRSWLPSNDSPLVPHDSTMSYAEILQSIRIIPSARLTGDTAEQPHGLRGPEGSPVDFEVYKPGGSFRKRDPGEPDFRVIVAKAGDKLPSVSTLQVLLQGQCDPEWPTEQPSASTGAGKGKKTMPSWPNLIYGIVDGAQVTFLRISNESATFK